MNRDIEDAASAVMDDVTSIGVTPLTGGSSARVALLQLRNDGGATREVVFRQHVDKVGKGHEDGVAATEYHLTRQLHDRGLPVPTPLALHGDRVVDGPWLVSEVVPGRPAVGCMADPHLVAQMARFLVSLHDLPPASLDVPGLEPIEDPIAALSGALPDGALGEQVEQCLDGVVVRRANDARLLHGDYWPGNVLVHGGRIGAVLDWEDAKLGDPLADLACVRLEITCDGGAAVADRFTTHYVRARPGVILDDLALWETYVSATALSSMHLWGLEPQDERARRTATTSFLAAAAGRLPTGPTNL